jgi:hypothetical protein
MLLSLEKDMMTTSARGSTIARATTHKIMLKTMFHFMLS